MPTTIDAWPRSGPRKTGSRWQTFLKRWTRQDWAGVDVAIPAVVWPTSCGMPDAETAVEHGVNLSA